MILPVILCIQYAQTFGFYQNFEDRPPSRASTRVNNSVTSLCLENMSKQSFSLHPLQQLPWFRLWLRNSLCWMKSENHAKLTRDLSWSLRRKPRMLSRCYASYRRNFSSLSVKRRLIRPKQKRQRQRLQQQR